MVGDTVSKIEEYILVDIVGAGKRYAVAEQLRILAKRVEEASIESIGFVLTHGRGVFKEVAKEGVAVITPTPESYSIDVIFADSNKSMHVKRVICLNKKQ